MNNQNQVEVLSSQIVELHNTQVIRFERLVEILEVIYRRLVGEPKEGFTSLLEIPDEEWLGVARSQRMFLRQKAEGGWEIGFKYENGWYPGVMKSEWNPKGLTGPDTAMAEDGFPAEEGGS